MERENKTGRKERRTEWKETRERKRRGDERRKMFLNWRTRKEKCPTGRQKEECSQHISGEQRAPERNPWPCSCKTSNWAQWTIKKNDKKLYFFYERCLKLNSSSSAIKESEEGNFLQTERTDSSSSDPSPSLLLLFVTFTQKAAFNIGVRACQRIATFWLGNTDEHTRPRTYSSHASFFMFVLFFAIEGSFCGERTLVDDGGQSPSWRVEMLFFLTDQHVKSIKNADLQQWID